MPAVPAAAHPDATAGETSIGLTRRRASVLAYSAGWISGLLVLWLEGRDRETRWHAAQAVLGFGTLTALTALCLVIAAVGLTWSLTVFRVGLWAAQGIIAVGLLLWVWSLAHVALGGTPRWPLLASRVDRRAGAPPARH